MPDNQGSLSTEKVTYRGFAKLDEKGAIDKFVARQVTGNQKAEDEKNKKLTEGGYALHNENEVIRYTALSLEGFETLVPNAEQRLYIINAGLGYVQNSKTSAAMAALEEDGVTPTYNGVEIDLREAINEAPQKRTLTSEEKLMRMLDATGASPEEKRKLIEFLASQITAQAAPQLVEETGVEA